MHASAVIDTLHTLPFLQQILVITIAAANLGFYCTPDKPLSTLEYTYHWSPAPRADLYLIEVSRPDSTGAQGEWALFKAVTDTTVRIRVMPPGGEIIRVRGLNRNHIGEIQEGGWSPESQPGSRIDEEQ